MSLSPRKQLLFALKTTSYSTLVRRTRGQMSNWRELLTDLIDTRQSRRACLYTPTLLQRQSEIGFTAII